MQKKINPDKLTALEKILGLESSNLELLKVAITHRSYINESNFIEHNERLEFLGDAVLELIITEFLFEKYPKRPEGELTSFRAALVKTESLAQTAKELNFGEFILMSKGEETTGGRQRPYILANTYESVLGFIYLDKGYKEAKKFVERTIIHKITDIVKNRLDIDNKSKLQEIAQEVIKSTPVYKLVEEKGPDHEKVFVMCVEIEGKIFGEGDGNNKQEAAQRAAGVALKNWKKNYKKYFNK